MGWVRLLGRLSILATVILIAVLVRNYLRLRKIPGPFIARFTNLWRVYYVTRGDAQFTYQRVHKKYGNVVRVGPNAVSVSGINAVQIVYNIHEKFPKSEFYVPQQFIFQGKPYQNLFNTTNEEFHHRIKKPVARAYAMSSIVEYEPFVNDTTDLFLRRLDELSGQEIDFSAWLQYYAFDVIGEMTFSRRFGFLEHGEDYGGFIRSLRDLANITILGQIPWVDRVFRKPYIKYKPRPTTSLVVKITMEQMQKRLKGVRYDDKEFLSEHGRRDFLSRFLAARQTYPDVVDDFRVIAYTTTNIVAGSDSTAITLRAIFYHLLRNPETMKTLLKELDAALQLGNISRRVTWPESQTLPYLDAVVKEALRIHPAVGLPLERIVTKPVVIEGCEIPIGTTVGVNAWVMHQDKTVFGDDADIWRPERWINASDEQKKLMNRGLFAFGGGTRLCIGRNISLLEIYKLVPTLLIHFNFEADPEKDWTLFNAVFVHQRDLRLVVRRRADGVSAEKVSVEV
ncbi:Cytochrome P450 monooxygenase [Drechslerella dactyloides]|uniref:Cytochrome P450 monooxygenase n=1 Tax=Drechslerella dactyloides TaxID=74499 RepID=A0AAD6NGL7_DREDA|nr:Cytochrome P450 monooxygenase [Drechslerella dactyloides]